MSKKEVKFAIQDFNKFIDDEDTELAIAKCCFLSTRPNSHGLVISEEVLRQCAGTILGKFLVGNMDSLDLDVKAHETRPEIYGYFPAEQEIEFVEKDGYLLAYAQAVVSKIYATSFYNIFIKDNFRNTSVEMLTLTSPDDDSIVESFNICGLTSLGKPVNGSCPDANMEIVRFSEDKATKYYAEKNLNFELNQFAQARQEQLKDNSVSSAMGDMYNQLELKEKEGEEKSMADIKEKDQIEAKLEDAEIEKEQPEEMAEEQPKEKVEEEKEEPENLAEIKEESEKDENVIMEEEPEKEDAEKEEDDDSEKAEPEAEEMGCKSNMEEVLAEKDKAIADLEEKVQELQAFKDATLEAQKMSIVNATLLQVKDYVEKDLYAAFEAKGKECKFEDVTSWKNEVLASITTNVLKMSQAETEVVRMGLPKDAEQTKSLWDKL